MSFLFPLFLIGGGMILAPIVSHLIRRSPKERLPFSTLMFLSPSEPTVSKRNKLDHIILLIMRCLVILLIAAAFARPYISGKLGAMSEAAPTSVVILAVDTSASMQRDGLWAAAVRRAAETVNGLPANAPVGLVTFDQRANVVARPLTSEAGDAVGHRQAILARLGEVKPGHLGTNLDDALIAAGELFDEVSSFQNQAIPLEGRVVVISDFAEGMELSGLQGYEWPDRLGFEWIPVKPSDKGNAGLELLAGERSSLSLNQPVRVRVRNSHDDERQQFSVQWKTGAGVSTNISVIVPSGESRLVTIADSAATDIVLSGDKADFDNRVYRLPEERAPVPVGYVGTAASDDVKGQLFYIRQAFFEDGEVPVALRTGSDFSQVLAGDKNLKLIIAGDGATADESALRSFVERGGTLVLTLESGGSSSAIAQSLSDGVWQLAPGSRSDYLLLGNVDFEHPLFATMSESRFSDFTKIHFWKHTAIRLRDDLSESVRVIATFDNQDPAVIEKRIGEGRIILFAFGWGPEQSQFALSSKYVPTMFSLLELSGGVTINQRRHFVGGTISLEPLGLELPIRMVSPSGESTTIDDLEFAPRAGMPGIYEFSDRNTTAPVAVNLIPDETETSPMDLDELEQLGVPVVLRSESDSEEQTRERAHVLAIEQEARQKLWKWLLAFAVVILFAETIYAGRLGTGKPDLSTT